ncbi:MAG: alpha/beta hydrolase [Actinomycetia bacterium]|nr:alpha/beta hydrolase [Actinomycetes bacterium]
MFASAMLAVMLTIPLAPQEPIRLVPGDGVGLDSIGPIVSPIGASPSSDGRRPPWKAWNYGGLGAVSLLYGVGLKGRRRRRSEDPVFVVVHGNGGSRADFDPLLKSLGATRANTVAFDYRSVERERSSTEASKVASTEVAAQELDRLIRRLSITHSNIYSIHHSKGGAVGVVMIASLDDGSRPEIDGYRGAALLDPAIASGAMGTLQRMGRIARSIPDNGGFDPIRCTDDGCRDVRANLGEAAGIDVIAIRNPDAVVTNFIDEPVGLRVFDLVDDGKSSALVAPFGIIGFQKRVSEAHRSVLTHPAVADCVKAEVLRSGSCVWKGDRKGRSRGRGSGSSGTFR